MGNIQPNENIIELRKLSQEICDSSNMKYRNIVSKLKNIVTEGKLEIETTKTPQSKILCYEMMCSKITKLLENISIKS